MTGNVLYVVHSNPKEGEEDEFNRWYSEVHVPEVLSVTGFLSARRYRLAEVQMIRDQPYRYVAIYEIEPSKLAEALDHLAAAAPGFRMSSSIDLANIHVAIYDAI